MIYTDKTAITFIWHSRTHIVLAFSAEIPQVIPPPSLFFFTPLRQQRMMQMSFCITQDRAFYSRLKTYSVPRTLWSVCDLHSQMPTGQWVYRGLQPCQREMVKRMIIEIKQTHLLEPWKGFNSSPPPTPQWDWWYANSVWVTAFKYIVSIWSWSSSSSLKH